MLECQVSRENAEVRWFREGQEIRKTKKYELISEGRRRALVIQACTPDDAKMYTCDAQQFKTSCFLEVTRKSRFSSGLDLFRAVKSCLVLFQFWFKPGSIIIYSQRRMWSLLNLCTTSKSKRKNLPSSNVKCPGSPPR